MANIILIALSIEGVEQLELLARHIRELRHSVQILRCFDASENTLRECDRKDLALVGFIGSEQEMQIGLRALNHIATRCLRCVVGVCLDELGYDFYSKRFDRPDRSRVRLGVFVGAQRHFPNAECFLRVRGPQLHIDEQWTSATARRVAEALVAECGTKVVNM